MRFFLFDAEEIFLQVISSLPNVINKDPKLLVQSQPPAGQLGVEENPVVSEKRKTMEDLAVGWSDGKCDTKITIVRQESSCPR